MERRTTLTTVASHIPLFADETLAFEPGAKFSYSNSGFMVLGLIVERVSGQNYYDYVAEHIFKPAGMTGLRDSMIPTETILRLQSVT